MYNEHGPEFNISNKNTHKFTKGCERYYTYCDKYKCLFYPLELAHIILLKPIKIEIRKARFMNKTLIINTKRKIFKVFHPNALKQL